ncbi:hypothetical protein D9M68_638900 [compost metagenome]
MRLDLDRVAVLGQPQAGQHALAEGGPIDFGICRQVGVVVAGGAVQLGQRLNGLDGGDGAVQARGHVGEFLAQRRRAGGLAVRARQHGLVGLGDSHFVQLGGELAQARHHDLVAGTGQHQRMRGVVDVLGGAGEMDEFGGAGQLGVIRHFFLQPVFDGLDVMVGDAFDVLDAGGVRFGEVAHQLLQARAGGLGKGRQLGQARIGQRDQPGHFDLDAVRHEACLRQQAAQRVAPGSVPAIQWRQGVELAKLIGDLHGLGKKKRGMSESGDFIIRKHATLWQTGEDSGLRTV